MGTEQATLNLRSTWIESVFQSGPRTYGMDDSHHDSVGPIDNKNPSESINVPQTMKTGDCVENQKRSDTRNPVCTTILQYESEESHLPNLLPFAVMYCERAEQLVVGLMQKR